VSNNGEVQIVFSGVTPAEANKLAASLENAISSSDPAVETRRVRDRPESQDGGTSVAFILVAAILSPIAKGIAAWLSRNSGTTIDIHRPDNTTVTIRYASGEDTAQTVKAALLGLKEHE
jgi:hypothetical protein